MADVCLMLEGTYPYVSGGVSSWVHQLISRLPNTTFDLVFFGAKSDSSLTPRYRLPPNVSSLREVFLFDSLPEEKGERRQELPRARLEALKQFHRQLHATGTADGFSPSAISRLAASMAQAFPSQESDSESIFSSLASRGIWEIVMEEYEKAGRNLPFIDFFYHWRSVHLPVYRALATRYPRARVYHSVSTGYAGLAAAQAARIHGAPLFLTEHGIYAHERAIEIAEADWLHTPAEQVELSSDPAADFRRWWSEMFRNLSRISYGFSSEVITLYEGNRHRQLLDGAAADRTRIIPNGISPTLRGLRAKNAPWPGPEAAGRPFRLGFVGRVVPIKDVKLLIKVMAALREAKIDIECEVVGPVDEDQAYYRECVELAGFLGLGERLKFLGKKNVADIYPLLDGIILTSVSEAQPLVILEANSAGIPVVATKVGACEELLEGRAEADRRLGISGLLAPLGDEAGLTAQLLRLVREPELWKELADAGQKRVAAFYDEQELISRYDLLYREHMSGTVRVSGRPAGILPWQE